MEQKNKLKKRKTIIDHFFNEEILSEIINYFNDLEDYLNLAHINNYFYELLLLKDNYLFNQFTELLFKKQLTLSDNLPNYIFKLKNLNLSSTNKDFDLLEKFTNLKYLKCYEIPEQYLIKLINLQKLSIVGKTLNENSLFKLKNLTSLNIDYNNVVKDEWIKYLTNLTELTLYFCKNNISGNCLSNLINLRKLHINIYLMNLTDDHLLNLNNLTDLNLNGCNVLNGNFFKTFKQLKVLQLNNCSRLLDNDLNYVNNLEILKINNCPKISCQFLQNLNNLQQLNIEITDNNVDCINKYLKYLTNVNYLNIISVKSKEFTTDCIKTLINLRYLKINFLVDNKLGIKDEDFNNLINLRELLLTTYFGNNLELKGSFCKYLIKLEIFYTKIILENNFYKYLTNVKKLFLIGNDYVVKEITDECIVYLKILRKLSIIGLKINIKEDHLQQLYNLQTITIDNSELLGNYSLFKLTPNLTWLSAIETNISDKDLTNLKELKSLHISKCDFVIGESFSHLNKLTELRIARCNNIDFKNLVYLTQLNDLKMDYTEVKDEDLNFLTNLHYLDITECCNLVSGKFLLQMNNLKELQIETKFEKKDIEEIKRKIKEGATLYEVIEEEKSTE
ncbi:hypothetical protein ABK040_013604 [Willaertia magna]